MAPAALSTTILGKENLRPLIEFALQLPLESHKMMPPLSYQQLYLDWVTPE